MTTAKGSMTHGAFSWFIFYLMLVFLGRISIKLAVCFLGVFLFMHFFVLLSLRIVHWRYYWFSFKKGLFTGSLSWHLDSEIFNEPVFPSNLTSLGSFLTLLKLIIKKSTLQASYKYYICTFMEK